MEIRIGKVIRILAGVEDVGLRAVLLVDIVDDLLLVLVVWNNEYKHSRRAISPPSFGAGKNT